MVPFSIIFVGEFCVIPHSFANSDTVMLARLENEEYLRITALARTLPPEQREVLYMKCIDGLKFREISDILDIPEATVKSRYRYAIQAIQKQLN